MKPRKPLPPRAKPIPRSPVKRKPRPAAETLRIYGPPARRAWVKSLGCLVCGGPAVSAHTPSRSGMGRKGDYTTIVPLCHAHHEEQGADSKAFELAYGVDLAAVAVNIQAAWVAGGANPRDTTSSPDPEC